MSTTYTEIKSRVVSFLKADVLNVLTDSDYLDAITDAIDVFSNDKPEEKCVLKTTDSTAIYDLPDDFDTDESRVIEVESPVDETPKSIIDEVYYKIDQFPSGYKLRFDLNNPSVSFYFRYTIPYAIEDDEDTTNIPDGDATTVAYKASSILCGILASHFSTKTDNNISELAEMIKYDERVTNWLKIKSHFEKQYTRRIKKKSRMTGMLGSVNDLSNDRMFFRRQ
jgi:hypothetical protein